MSLALTHVQLINVSFLRIFILFLFNKIELSNLNFTTEIFGMKNQHSSNETIWSRIRRLVSDKSGQMTVMFAFSLPAMVGIGALAVDGGQMYVARNIMQNASDAGARAGTAILAAGGTQGEAEAEAVNFASKNLASVSYFSGVTPVVTFPTAQSVQVSISHDVPLVLAPALGINTAGVATSATAELASVRAVEPGQLIPLAIYCNNTGGCSGALAVGQVLTAQCYCGNYFDDGNSGSSCGTKIKGGEIFVAGITFDDNNSNSEFRFLVQDGQMSNVELGQSARSLPGTRTGWQDGMTTRLSEGRDEVVLPVIKEASGMMNGDYNVVIVDFVKVRITSFSSSGSSDQITFEIIQSSVSTSDYSGETEGLGINSVVGVRLSG